MRDGAALFAGFIGLMARGAQGSKALEPGAQNTLGGIWEEVG